MITSVHNPRIRQIKNLLANKKDRYAQRLFVIEGLRLVEDAFLCGVIPQFVLTGPDLSPRGEKIALDLYRKGVLVEGTTRKIMESISDTENPQGLLAIVPFLEKPIPADFHFAVLADTIRDPGNLGTILRSAAGAGVQAALLSPACVDPYNPKVVRAGMGAHFRLPVLQADWNDLAQILKQRPGQPALTVISTQAAGKKVYWEVDMKQPVCVVVSSEAEGTSLKAIELSDEFARIPMPGQIESLNAAAAASILMFEVVRQRSNAGGTQS